MGNVFINRGLYYDNRLVMHPLKAVSVYCRAYSMADIPLTHLFPA
jgi:hypothetical protein